MTNYALPVNDKDISKAKTFYDLSCWGGLLIVLLPVGIANVILGYFMGGSLLCTCDDLRINDKCQVYDTNHKTIGGLYAIGNCSGSFFSGNYPEFFVGVAVGRTMTQGRLAVKAILENA